MPPRRRLTSEQRHAACCPAQRLLVVSAPGCGKTTVAAERFGFHRYSLAADRRRCLALSFTRAATSEYERRILRRWGPSALSWPHQAMTLDSLHVELVESLLRSGDIHWPSGHTRLIVEDSWWGRGGQRCVDGRYVSRPVLDGGLVKVASAPHQGIPVTRISRAADLKKHFDNGRATHLEVREVLGLALEADDLREALGRELGRTTRALVVDEVFDGDDVDLAVVRLASDIGLEVTLIGDHWQAIYEFRGADPTQSRRRIDEAEFDSTEVKTSFRFRTEHMRSYADTLRSQNSCLLDERPVDQCDVVLASEWNALWECGSVVLPLSFGLVRNRTDAAVLVLLDYITVHRLGRHAVHLADAHALLGLDGSVAKADLHAAASEIVAEMSGPVPHSSGMLDRWREQLRRIGVSGPIRRLEEEREAIRVGRLSALADRLASPRSILGMTVHQAKGGEWPNVGLRLNSEERNHLAAGLDPALERDRVVYVAATRAMDDVWLI